MSRRQSESRLLLVEQCNNVEHTMCSVLKLRHSLPDDGLPVLEDWLTVFGGMLFSGVELSREPIDVTARVLKMDCACVTVVNLTS